MRRYNILSTPVIKTASLSKDALKRLTWIDWYFSHEKNAELTCRHFGIAKSVFYRWFNEVPVVLLLLVVILVVVKPF